jgi:hypothetical protein
MGPDRHQLVGRIVLFWAASQRVQELLVPAGCGRSNVLHVGETPAGPQVIERLPVQGVLTVGCEVVDREARHDHVEFSEVGREWLVEIMTANLDGGLAAEPGSGAIKHLVLEIEADPGGTRTRVEDETEREAVAGSEVEDPVDGLGKDLEEHLVRLGPMGNPIAGAEIRERMFAVPPQVDVVAGGHA